MNISKRFSSKLCLTIFAVIFAVGSANAQQRSGNNKDEEDTTKTKQAQAVSKEFYDKIQKAQESVDAQNYSAALRTINTLYNPEKLTEYEQAQALNYLGFIYYNMDDVAGALRTYEKLLAIPSLEPQMAKQTTYTVAQLNVMEERYAQALSWLDRWFLLETNPQPDSFILKAQILYQLQRYPDMIPAIETAMQVAREKNKEVKEDWYVLLNFAYFQQEDYVKVRDIQKILLANWPKKRYWFSLAGAYTELGEDQNLIAAYAAAFDQGMLEKESELVTMAQLFMQREVPYKAAQILSAEMEAGRVSKVEKNYRLLSQAWMLAMEDQKAIPALKEAARLADDGELDVRLGNAFLNISEYGECVTAVRNGIRKGGLKNPDNAQISLGMCLYNLREYQNSIKAFRAAAKTPRSRKVANQWINVINADIARNEQIRLAQRAAEKKRKEVDERRKASDRV